MPAKLDPGNEAGGEPPVWDPASFEQPSAARPRFQFPLVSILVLTTLIAIAVAAIVRANFSQFIRLVLIGYAFAFCPYVVLRIPHLWKLMMYRRSRLARLRATRQRLLQAAEHPASDCADEDRSLHATND